jgi:hypothetical protein
LSKFERSAKISEAVRTDKEHTPQENKEGGEAAEELHGTLSYAPILRSVLTDSRFGAHPPTCSGS